MSFLKGRLAGAEGAYFYQETKHAVARLVQNNRNLPVSASKAASSAEHEGQADVLPEVLRHSLPSKIFHQQPLDSSLSSASKWVLHSDPKATSTPSSNDMNPLRAYLSLPQVTFGPKGSVFFCSVAEGVQENVGKEDNLGFIKVGIFNLGTLRRKKKIPFNEIKLVQYLEFSNMFFCREIVGDMKEVGN